MTRDTKKSDCEVGYKKPPVKSRFRKGQSGNPAGRPKQATLEAVNVMDVLNESVKVTLGGKSRNMDSYEATIRRLVTSALKDGKLDAAIRFLRLCSGMGLLKQQQTCLLEHFSTGQLFSIFCEIEKFPESPYKPRTIQELLR